MPEPAMQDWKPLWNLDPEVVFLNHGSFGACPRHVLAVQTEWRLRMERDPVQFLARDLEGRLDEARAAVAGFVGCDAQDLVFVPNATTGVNAVLRSLRLRRGDELLTTDHAYNACRNTLDFVAGQAGAKVVTAHVPFPLSSADEVVRAFANAASERTKLALLDVVTSPSGLILPVERIVRELAGIDVLLDGAHAPGMIPLDLRSLNVPFFTGNCHKWLCAPKGAGILYVRPDRQADVRPTVISHGASAQRPDRSRFLLEFDWTGTGDPSPYLCVPEAIAYMGSLLPGGWDALRRHNRELALEGRRGLCEVLSIQAPCPDDMIGSLASVPLPPPVGPTFRPFEVDPLQAALRQQRIEVPVFPWPEGGRTLRISAQLYNRPEEYRRLAAALAALL
jgi:isopenicillin-N epimerase